jgi:hypothetical protein
MISVLDMLRSRLGGSGQSDRVMEDMLRGTLQPAPSEADRRLQAMGQNLPEYLPEQVWNSILNKPMYDEGTRIPGPRNPLMEQEAAAGSFSGPQRDQQLPFNRAEALGIVNPNGDPWNDLSSRAVPEGGMWSTRPPGQSPFASPLNQLMQLGRRAPLSMY